LAAKVKTLPADISATVVPVTTAASPTPAADAPKYTDAQLADAVKTEVAKALKTTAEAADAAKAKVEHEAALAKATAEGNYKAQVELLTAEKNAALEAVKEEKRERERDALKLRREAAALKFKLPSFARDVLKGNTTEELEADAAAKRKEMEAAGIGPATGTGPAIPVRSSFADNGGFRNDDRFKESVAEMARRV
jgi:hypothetical protein